MNKRNEIRWKLATLSLSLVLIGVILMIPYMVKNVSEDKFCQDKISEYYPEYDFAEITFKSASINGWGETEGIDYCLGKTQKVCLARVSGKPHTSLEVG